MQRRAYAAHALDDMLCRGYSRYSGEMWKVEASIRGNLVAWWNIRVVSKRHGPIGS